MSERLYGVVVVILLIAIAAAAVTIYLSDKKIDQLLTQYPTGNSETDKLLSDGINSAMLTAASLSKSKPTLSMKTDANGWTPLHWAAARNHVKMAKLLLALRVDVNTPDKNGWTPLHWTASHGCTDVAKLLILHNADVNLADEKGLTPVKLAEQNGQKETAVFLSQHGGMD